MTNISEYNGGSLIAMTGKNCVAIACDKRLGMQAMTVSTDFPKVFPVNNTLFYGLAGLATDVLTVSEELRYRTDLYRLEEAREIAPKPFANLLSSLLYSHRFGSYFVSPVVAGLDPKTKEPFVAATDSIGCLEVSQEFVVSGTCAEALYGMSEALWKPDQEPEQLFETISQVFCSALDRDALSGWGVDVWVVCGEDRVIKRTLKTRQD
jgi:20S proteasome subunit beta 3